MFYERMIHLPRTARIKVHNGIYHIIMRSIKEFNLFRNKNDKDKFLEILKKYKDIFLFKIFAYCLMDTHVHLLIYSNEADISKFMHSINQSYAQYYNKKYDRHGHVFSDRFKSKIAKEDADVAVMSAYIHNNPKDIKGYKNSVENYEYSSFSTYIGTNKNQLNLVDCFFILNYFNKNPILSRNRYLNFVKNRISKTGEFIDIKLDIDPDKSINNSIEYISGKTPLLRTLCPEKVMEFIYENTNIDKVTINIKYNREISGYRCLCVLIMRCFCDFTFAQISQIINNYTQSSLSQMCNKAYNLICNNAKYKNILEKFLDKYSLATT